MTLKELHRIWDIELDKLNVSSYPSFLPEEKDYWINASTQRFIKTRYSGLNAHRAGFQQNQKRSDDLRTVIKSISFSISPYNSLSVYDSGDIVISERLYYRSLVDNNNTILTSSNWSLLSTETDSINFEYPLDYMLAVGEYVKIGTFTEIIEGSSHSFSNNIVYKRTDIIEATIENVDSKLGSSISEHKLHNNHAKPIRLFSDNNIILFTDGNYYINKYGLTYLFIPEKINTYKYSSFSATTSYYVDNKVLYNGQHYKCIASHPAGQWNISHFEEIPITIMPEHTWDEILVGAVRLALENISESRYQTYAAESQATE